MKKLLQKKASNKGFTLAELLVVISILAILIAIAVPVFSGMVADANLRVNQANVRTVRSAAVAHILTHLDDVDAGGVSKLNAGIRKKNVDGTYTTDGWVAVALVDNAGNIEDLRIWVTNNYNEHPDGIAPVNTITGYYSHLAATTEFYRMTDNVKDPFATVKPKDSAGSGRAHYVVQASIKDLDPMS